jgi:hypothetical protein
MRILKAKRTFRKEFKRQLKYAVAAACGFLIAFAWKDAIVNSTKELMERLVENAKITTTATGSALLITIIGVFVIIISSRLLRDK